MGMVEKLQKADRAYYAGKPIMSDADYDSLRRTAKQNHPDHPYFNGVGAPVAGVLKAKHEIAMGSLDNVFTREEFNKWYNRTAGKFKSRKICLQHKLDGLSVELIYEDGLFVKGITRGDGIEGEIVTDNVRRSNTIPTHLDATDDEVEGRVVIRAECMLFISDFKKHFSDMENARNAAAGTLRRKNGKRSEYLHYLGFDLTFIGEEDSIGEEDDIYQSESRKLYELSEFGFETPTQVIVSSSDEAWAFVQECELGRDDLDIEIDGVVVKIDNLSVQNKLGIHDMRPRGQRAIKFKPPGGNTRLEKVESQVGRTGAVTPVAKVKPVRVGGVTIKSVTLHNWDEVKRLGVQIGDTVEVVRAGDVIPKITRVISKNPHGKEIKPPTVCPSCGNKKLVKKGASLLCEYPRCRAQMFRAIMNWIKKRNILYIGDGIVQSAFDDQIITWPIDLYKMDAGSWADVYVGNGKLGEKRALTIEGEIANSRTMLLADFIGCLGIKLCGRSVAKKIMKALDVHTLPDFLNRIEEVEGNEMALLNIPGIGVSVDTSIRDYFNDEDNRETVIDFANILDIQEPKIAMKTEDSGTGVLLGKTVCFTGDAGVKRSKLQQLVEDKGGVVSSGVTKDLDILVIADPNSQSAKAKKARKQGTELMSPDKFLELVEWEF